MSCYHPLKAFHIGTNPRTGKSLNKIVSYGTHHLEEYNGVFTPVSSDFYAPGASSYRSEWIEIPCGNCVGCRLDYSRTWADRLVLEYQHTKKAMFLTLTYNNEHVPLSAYPDLNTGEAYPIYTLNKRDVQLFMKRLRKRFSDREIRFFLSGEYGELSFRPHYHLIVFGLDLSDFADLSIHGKNDFGDLYYISPTLSRLWSVKDSFGNYMELGFILAASFSWNAAAYVARYVMKKYKGQASSFYDYFNIVPEFCLMSRKPGIGSYYLDDHPDIFDYSRLHLDCDGKQVSMPIPKYFIKKLENLDCSLYYELKEVRRLSAELHRDAELGRTSLPYLEYLELKESQKANSIKALPRSKV